MSQQKSDSTEGPSLIVCVIAGLAWQGLKTIAAKPHLLSGRRSSSVAAQISVHGSKIVPRYVPTYVQQETSSAERNERKRVVYPTVEFTRLRDSLGADRRTVNFDWALGEVRNQKTEGACTAFALSAAVEMILKARFHIDAKIDVQRFWASYNAPYMNKAMAAASRTDSALYATVTRTSALHPFSIGQVLHVSIKPEDFEVIGLSKVAFALSEKQPIIFSSAIAADGFWNESRLTGFIPARRHPERDRHAWLMSGVSRGLKVNGDVWFHMRNSWGSEWGQGGNAKLNAMHCVLNECAFIAVKNIILRELNDVPTTGLIALDDADSIDEDPLLERDDSGAESGEEDLLLGSDDGDEP